MGKYWKKHRLYEFKEKKKNQLTYMFRIDIVKYLNFVWLLRALELIM